MADDQPNRQVRFNEDPVSNIIFAQDQPPLIVVRATPPSPRSPSPPGDTSALSPNRGRLDIQSSRSRYPSPYPSREARSYLSSGNGSFFDGNGACDQESWSRERESDGIEDSRASQTKNAIQHFLYSYGDVRDSLETTRRVLDELVTDFITELCFEASRSAQLAGRQKIKIDDIRFACRKSPIYLGKIQDVQQKKEAIDNARKTLDVNDDKITKSNVRALEEPPLGDGDDDPDVDTQMPRGKGASSK